MNRTETLLKKDWQQETDEIKKLIDAMTPTERKKMLVFIQGVVFAKENEKAE